MVAAALARPLLAFNAALVAVAVACEPRLRQRRRVKALVSVVAYAVHWARAVVAFVYSLVAALFPLHEA